MPELAPSPEGVDLLRRSIDSHMPVFISLSRASVAGKPRIALPGPAERYASYLARTGTSLSTMLRTYEVGHAEFWRLFAQALRSGPHQLGPHRRADTLEHTSALMFDYIQGVTALAVTAHSRTSALLARRSSTQRAETVDALLSGGADEATAEASLGYRLAPAHVAYIAWVDDRVEQTQLEGVIKRIVDQVGPQQHVAVPHGDHAVYGWLTASEDDWSRTLGVLAVPPGTHLAVGSAHPGVEGFRASHREALEARRVADTLAADRPVLFDRIAVIALASRDVELARSLVDRELGCLASTDPSMRRLVRTLEIYLGEMASPTRAGRRLVVHRNTVIQRLERIEELLGRPIDATSLSLRVAVALAPFVYGGDRSAR
ncbi:PucR family transcriptional regulator [Nitriliruptor alkaliphilus]|uniref:PucR family transcriptional regulator n=1 Tax=Nitriliruptor alkaliphilus TaxID=427918 RepID=UPI0012EEC9BA|nr:helix-turn-helix domain-containing protein [Nitriliruptor alkaliphilus]